MTLKLIYRFIEREVNLTTLHLAEDFIILLCRKSDLIYVSWAQLLSVGMYWHNISKWVLDI